MNGMHRNNAIDPGLVRAKAYEIWQSLGCPEGAAEQTWFEAERQLMSRPAKLEHKVPSITDRVLADSQPQVAASPVSEPPPPSHDRTISEPPTAATTDFRPKKNASSPRRTTRR